MSFSDPNFISHNKGYFRLLKLQLKLQENVKSEINLNRAL